MENETVNHGRIVQVNIEREMKTDYIDYAMSVIVARALPDVRDGMKPIHRRVLYGMSELGLTSGGQHKKSARIVGEVMGKYHPHGDASIYDAMARMAQDWSLRYMLVDGQGNFGSVDGDSPAAMRYTEARFKRLAEECLADLDRDTVDFTPNFDETLKEPTVLPCKAPLLLLNGAQGIAVGMATNMAPHNMGELADGICAYIDNPDITVDELMQHIKGPDFPTGGIIQGISGVREAYETGRGRVVIRSKADIEVSESGRETIVISEIPYLVNKKELIEKIAELVNDKKIDGISYLNDESDSKGMRIVIRLKMGAVSSIVLNTLYKMTPLQSSFSVNNIALVDGRPRLLNLKQLLKYFVRHRHNVVVRRANFDLAKAQARAHILEGLLKALDIIDEIIALIKASESTQAAKDALVAQYAFSEIQANEIVEMKLKQLTGLERNRLQKEYDDLMAKIRELQEFLGSEELQYALIKKETLELKGKYDDGRRTQIEYTADDFDPEDFYPNEDVVITISHLGYIKRTSLSEYKLQNRGGVGSKGSLTRDEDFIEHIYVANMHSTMLFFTAKGKCYWLKVYNIPEGVKASKGRAIQNVINIESDDSICAYINVKNLNDEEYINSHYVILATKRGVIKKTLLEAYSRPRANGVAAINIREDDALLEAIQTDGAEDILIAARKGRCVRFPEDKARAIGRTATGVRGIDIEEDDEVIGMICIPKDEMETKNVMAVSANGYGKRSLVSEYRVTNRGGKGVKTLNITEKTGDLIALKAITDENDLMIINKSGITIRVPADSIRIAGRATQGVRLISLRDGDEIAAVCPVDKSEEKPVETGEDL
ncbi:MAG: DNA gyrase subunit A [Bacteroidales bacterium]|nr:DNA gyrase subunit A [Bacteroidales bacterium]